MNRHIVQRSSSWRRWMLLVVSLLLLAGGGTVWVLNDERREPTTLPNPVIGRTAPSATSAPSPTPSNTPEPSPTTKGKPVRAFVPQAIGVADVGTRSVQSLGRIRVGENGFSLPDPEGLDPQVYAWDREGAKPGSRHGSVNLTAHTYPPGQQALGNQLYGELQIGDIVTVRGESTTLRYRVTERVEVAVADYPASRVLDETGTSVLTITVCSGERRGPGDWSMRTIWFARPMK